MAMAQLEADGAGNPAIPWSASPPNWQTTAERSGFTETDDYAAALDYARRLADAAPQIQYRSLGRSPEGREMPALIVSKAGVTSPEHVDRDRLAVALIHCCIHPGEVEGRDAMFLLMRDLTIAGAAERAALLDHVVLIVVPMFNTDGCARFGPHHRINQNGPKRMGWRVTSTNLNLNRDWTKADTPEMRATLALWNEWDPDLHFDLHTTDGGDWQYDVTFDVAHEEDIAEPLRTWVNEALWPHIMTTLASDGHVPLRYFGLVDDKDPSRGIRAGPLPPRFSTGYAPLRNRPSLLVETHMLKDYRTRVIGQYNIVRRTLELIAARGDELRRAIRASDEEAARTGQAYDPQRRWPLRFSSTDESEPIVFKGFAWRTELSEISGDVWISYDPARPADVETKYFGKSKVVTSAAPPLAYLIPLQWTDVIERLRLHGIRTRTINTAIRGTFESYRFSDVKFAALFEGRHAPDFKLESVREERDFAAGAVLVPMDQPLARLAFHLLEPEGYDSFVRWGFFNAIFEQKEYAESYVLEDLARQMMAADPNLREAFMAKLSADRAFAASPSQRLDFFYARSLFADPVHNRYPIVRVVEPIELKETE